MTLSSTVELRYHLTDNNWFYYTVNGEKWGRRTSVEDNFQVHFDVPSDLIVEPFHVEMAKAAKRVVHNAIYNHHSKGIAVFYSGGIDSEIMLRALKTACKAVHYPLQAITLEFPNKLNIGDVTTAVETCKAIKIPHEVVHHNVEEFAASDMFKTMSSLHSCSQIAYLSVMRYAPWFDAYTVCLGGEILFQKHWDNFGRNPQWYYVYREDEDAMTYRFSMYHDIPVINEFMTYTPGLFFSWFNHPRVQDLFHGESGRYKLSMISSKNSILNECYFKPLGIEPSAKVKHHGYEQLMAFNETVQASLRANLLPMQEARVSVNDPIFQLTPS
jgi:hypothetical protein